MLDAEAVLMVAATSAPAGRKKRYNGSGYSEMRPCFSEFGRFHLE